MCIEIVSSSLMFLKHIIIYLVHNKKQKHVTLNTNVPYNIKLLINNSRNSFKNIYFFYKL